MKPAGDQFRDYLRQALKTAGFNVRAFGLAVGAVSYPASVIRGEASPPKPEVLVEWAEVLKLDVDQTCRLIELGAQAKAERKKDVKHVLEQYQQRIDVLEERYNQSLAQVRRIEALLRAHRIPYESPLPETPPDE